jgi:hypothetical protein
MVILKPTDKSGIADALFLLSHASKSSVLCRPVAPLRIQPLVLILPNLWRSEANETHADQFKD